RLFVTVTTDDLGLFTLGGLDRDLFLGNTRRHDSDDREFEIVEHAGLGRQQGHHVTYVQRAVDVELTDVDFDAGGDEARQDRDMDLTTLNVELAAALADADGRARELEGHVDVDLLVGGDGVEIDVHAHALALVHLY